MSIVKKRVKEYVWVHSNHSKRFIEKGCCICLGHHESCDSLRCNRMLYNVAYLCTKLDSENIVLLSCYPIIQKQVLPQLHEQVTLQHDHQVSRER